MKAKILTFSLFFAVFFGFGTFFFSTKVIYHGHSVGSVVELQSHGRWPFQMSSGLFQETYGPHQSGFIVKNEELAQRLAQNKGRELVFEVQSTFFHPFAPYNLEIISFREVPLATQDLSDDEHLCRLVSVIARSQTMVEVLKKRIERYDPQLLPSLRDCQHSE